jgi:hypothetical protein
MTDQRRETEPDLDPELQARFDELAAVEVPDVWAGATARAREAGGDGEPPVPVALAPVRAQRTRRTSPWLTSVAAVIAAIGVIALIAVVRKPIEEPPAAAATTTVPALAVRTLAAPTVDGVTTIELELGYDAIGEELLPNAVYVLREGAAFPEAIAFTGCLAVDDVQMKLIQPAYVVDAPAGDATMCGLGSILLRPGDVSTLTIVASGLPTGSYRVALAGWGSEPFEVITATDGSVAAGGSVPSDASAGATTTTTEAAALSFTELSLQELPDGYTFESAVRDSSGDPQVGMARFVGPEGQPALVLLTRATPDFFRTPIELGRETWPVNGRTVVNDGEGDGSCLPDVCSVGVQWDDSTAVSVLWMGDPAAGVELGPEHTVESLVVIAATLMEVPDSFYRDGSIAPAEDA